MSNWLSPKELALLTVPESDLEAQEISQMPSARFAAAQALMSARRRSSEHPPAIAPFPPDHDLTETARLLTRNWKNSEANYATMRAARNRAQQKYKRGEEAWDD